MTAAAALLRSVRTKLARAPQLQHPRPPLGRGLHGGARSGAGDSLHGGARSGAGDSLTPPGSDKDLIIADLRRRLSIACAAAGIGAATITGTVVYLFFWVRPNVEAHYSGMGTSVEELAESMKRIRAKLEEQAAFREEGVAKLEAAMDSLRRSKSEGGKRAFESGTVSLLSV